MPAPSTDALFLEEQRKFRRLEVSLPVWISLDGTEWKLGFTRDVSMGGAKVIVAGGDEKGWKNAVTDRTEVQIRFDESEQSAETIAAWVRFAKPDSQTGRFVLGIQFDDRRSKPARQKAVNAGLKTMRQRRKWQGAFAGALVLVLVAGVAISRLNAEVARKNAQIFALTSQRKNAESQLESLSKPTLATTRAEGLVSSFRRKEVQRTIRDLTNNIERLNDPKNMQAALKERERAARALGLNITPPTTAARAQLAVAVPYGYNWPLVITDLEALLKRKVPHVVVFTDYSMPFPAVDAQEARARGKVLQVTWEPWHFSNPNAVKLKDIAAGKWDKYIDTWASGARAFGGELWVRWGHEFNGNWYPWSSSANGASPQMHIAAYKRIRARFRAAGASNVRWIWCFNAENVPNVAWNDPLKAYPGDDLVDAIAIDGYNFGRSIPYGRWLSFREIFGIPYWRVTKAHPNKPIWIGETGCSTVGGDKVAWLKEMDKSLRSQFARVESVTWFEAQKEADWRLVSSPGSLNMARAIWNQPYYRRGGA